MDPAQIFCSDEKRFFFFTCINGEASTKKERDAQRKKTKGERKKESDFLPSKKRVDHIVHSIAQKKFDKKAKNSYYVYINISLSYLMAEPRGRNNEGEKAFTEFDNYKRKIENFFINNKEYLTTLSQQFYYFNSRKQLQSIFADRGNKLQKEVTALKEKIQEFKKDINSNRLLTDADKNALLNTQLEQELEKWPFLNEPIELQTEDLIPFEANDIALVPEEDDDDDDDETELFHNLTEAELAEATSEEKLHAEATDLEGEDPTERFGFEAAENEEPTEIVIHQLNGEEVEDDDDTLTADTITPNGFADELPIPPDNVQTELIVAQVPSHQRIQNQEATAPLPKRVGGREPVLVVDAEAERENTPTERRPAAEEILPGDEEKPKKPLEHDEKPTDKIARPEPVATPSAPKPEPTTAAPAAKETSKGVLSGLQNSAAKFVKRFAVFAALLGLSGNDQEKNVSGNANDRAAAVSAEMNQEANPNTQSVENTQDTVIDNGTQAVKVEGGNQNHIVAKGEGITHVLERLSSKEEMIKIAFTERISLDGQSIPLKDVLVKNANALGINVEKNSDGSIAHFTFFDAHTGQKIEGKNLSQYLYVEKEAPLPQTIDAQVDQDEQETELR